MQAGPNRQYSSQSCKFHSEWFKGFVMLFPSLRILHSIGLTCWRDELTSSNLNIRIRVGIQATRHGVFAVCVRHLPPASTATTWLRGFKLRSGQRM